MAVSIILILIIVILMLISKIKILTPAGIQNFMWIFFIIGSYALLSPNYSFTYKGVIWILLYCLFNTIIFAEVTRRASHSRNSYKNNEELISYYAECKIPWNLLSMFLTLSFLSFVIKMLNNGLSMGIFHNLNTLQTVSHTMAVQHYAGGNESSIMEQILNTFLYISPLASGYSLVHADNKRRKLLCLSSFVPILLVVILTTTKLALIAYVIFFLVGFLTAYISRYHCVPNVNTKVLLGGISAFGFLMLVFYLSFWLRIGASEADMFTTIITKLGIYCFGHIQGFDQWFAQYSFKLAPKFGMSTFLAFSSKLLGHEKQAGVYGIIANSCTNVYTQFRPLIEDFTPSIALAVILILSVISAFQYINLVNCRNTITCQLLFAINLFYFLYFIISAWTYTSYVLTFLLFWIFLVFTYKLEIINYPKIVLGRN